MDVSSLHIWTAQGLVLGKVENEGRTNGFCGRKSARVSGDLREKSPLLLNIRGIMCSTVSGHKCSKSLLWRVDEVTFFLAETTVLCDHPFLGSLSRAIAVGELRRP
jgi:hypothetical protein